MHEMSIAMSLLDMAEEEARKRGLARITKIRVEYGVLGGIMADAFNLCFEALCAERGHDRIELELVRIPLKLRCHFCGHVFGGESREDQWQPCPACGEILGHIVEQGTELVLARLEACRE